MNHQRGTLSPCVVVPCTTCPRHDSFFFSSPLHTPKCSRRSRVSFLSVPFALTPTHLLSRVLFTSSRRRKSLFFSFFLLFLCAQLASTAVDCEGATIPLLNQFPLLSNFNRDWPIEPPSRLPSNTCTRSATMKFMAVAVEPCCVHRSFSDRLNRLEIVPLIVIAASLISSNDTAGVFDLSGIY